MFNVINFDVVSRICFVAGTKSNYNSLWMDCYHWYNKNNYTIKWNEIAFKLSERSKRRDVSNCFAMSASDINDSEFWKY